MEINLLRSHLRTILSLFVPAPSPKQLLMFHFTLLGQGAAVLTGENEWESNKLNN